MRNEIDWTARDLLVLLLLVIASTLSAMTYTTSYMWLFTREVTYYPDLVSGLASVVMVAVLLATGQFRPMGRLTGPLIIVALFYLLAFFCTVAIGEKGFLQPIRSLAAVLWTPTISVPVILIAIGSALGGAWRLTALAALAFFGLANMIYASGVMGFRGFLIAAAFGGAALLLVDPKTQVRGWTKRAGAGPTT